MVFLYGCGRDSPTGPENGRVIPLVSPHTCVVTADGDFTLLDRNGSTFVIRAAEDAPEIRVGYIIVGADRGGFLRRVKAVRETTGALVLDTEPASLTDAVIVGRIDTTIDVGAGSHRACLGTGRSPGRAAARAWTPALLSPGVTLSDEGLDLAGVILLDAGGGDRRSTIMITNGNISFNPHVEMGATVRARSIDRLHASAEGMLRFSCDLSIDMPEPIDAAGEIPLASFSATFVQQIGAVPVVETVTLVFAAGYEVSGAFAGDCDMSFEATALAGVVSSYRDGGWIDGGAVDPSLAASPFTCGAYADADIRIYVRPHIDISFYAVPAIELGAMPRLRVRAETPAAPVWEWAVEGGIDVSSLIDARILDEELAPHTATPASFNTELDTGPFSTDEFVFVIAWGGAGSDDGRFLVPRGIAVDAAPHIYVVDSHVHRVQVFRPDSTFVTGWGGQGTGDGQFKFPNGIAAGAAGHVYVVDADNRRVQKFRSDGAFVTAWGVEGTGDGEFKDPQGIAVSAGGDVFVTDAFIHRIQQFTADGAFVTAWGSFGEGTGEFDRPMGIAVGGDGTVYVSECGNQRIQAFTTSGEFLHAWGSFGTGDGEFDCPIDVAVDVNGTVYVVDYGNDRVQVFAPDGRFLAKLGSTGNGDGQFNRPAGIAVDALGQLYIVDSENKRVQRFAPKIR